MKRNRADVGRLIAGMLIVACLIMLPLRQYALSERATYENVIQAAVDRCTDRVGATSKFTVQDFEELSRALYNTGTVYDIELEVGRFTEDLRNVRLPDPEVIKYLLGEGIPEWEICCRADEVECDCVGMDRTMRTVAAHVHTQNCYIGHNHQACGCTFDGKVWSCGIASNDTYPICDSVVVSADWAKTQTIESGHGAAILEGGQFDNSILLTMMDGSVKNVKGKVMAFDDVTAGTKTVAMVYNAYYDTAYNNLKTTRTFSVTVTVKEEGRTCPICGLSYDRNPDGSDPGCPYCHNKIIDVTANPYNVYATVGDAHALDGLAMIAQYADGHTEEVPYTSDFDASVAGLSYITATIKGAERVSYTDRGTVKEVAIADNEKTAQAAVRLSTTFTCPVCLTDYTCALDGSDPGCPYCNDRVMDLRIVPVKTEYDEGEPLEINVFAVFRNGETKLDDYAWYSDYNPWQQGVQKVNVFHENLIETIEVKVADPYQKVCPVCGNVFDTRVDMSCPVCDATIVGLEVSAVPTVYTYGEDLTLTVWVEYQSGAKVLLSGGYIVEGYDEYYTEAPQTVTVSYKGVSDSVVVSVMPKTEIPTNIVVCPNGHFYELNQDGTDPGCPYCAGAGEVDGSLGGVYFTDMMYTSEVLAWLDAYGFIEFEKGDSFTIRVIPKHKTLAHKVSDIFIKTKADRNVYVSGITF